MKDIIEKVRNLNPYKQRGNRESYSEYNQGWDEACSELETQLETYSPWISVNDSLPQTDVDVLCLFPEDGKRRVCSYEEGGEWLSSESLLIVKPTYWRELPKPPAV